MGQENYARIGSLQFWNRATKKQSIPSTFRPTVRSSMNPNLHYLNDIRYSQIIVIYIRQAYVQFFVCQIQLRCDEKDVLINIYYKGNSSF